MGSGETPQQAVETRLLGYDVVYTPEGVIGEDVVQLIARLSRERTYAWPTWRNASPRRCLPSPMAAGAVCAGIFTRGRPEATCLIIIASFAAHVRERHLRGRVCG